MKLFYGVSVKSWYGVFDTPNGEKYEIGIDEGYGIERERTANEQIP
jgi:hypothetical protein